MFWLCTSEAESPFQLVFSTSFPVDNKVCFEANPPSNPEGIPDMVQMQTLNEPELLNNLRLRYSQSLIFTYIGPSLLIMNPYQEIPNLLSESKIIEILESRNTLQPNIYSVALNAMLQLENSNKNQAIVISGESGAGKTETTKHCMRFLTYEGKQKGAEKPIAQRILDCNPILEAFGNAKTVRNDNSSRFGKYVRLLVSKMKGSEKMAVQGATITSYLLEKSRVIGQSQNERNFHIFYYLLSGIDGKMRESLQLDGFGPEKLEYLNKSQCFQVQSINDAKGFSEVLYSLHDLGFPDQEITDILSILSAIILLGNLEFSTTQLSDSTSCCFTPNDDKLPQKISLLLKVSPNDLEKTLVWKVREVGKQQILSPLGLSDCEGLRDSLAKNLYEKLFLWLVKRLNLTVFPEEMRGGGISGRDVRKSIKTIRKSIYAQESARNSIGLLDIFGFENFASNSLEQLCINFTNEKLQQLYVSYIYKSEEAELKAQGFDASYLEFQDNQAVLDLIEKYPLSILDLLDESSALGSSTDEHLLASFNKSLGSNQFFKASIQNTSFTIAHTAKSVSYSIKGFRTKNRDEITKEIENLLSNAGNPIVHETFSEKDFALKTRKFLAGKFKGQIRDLMTELSSCDVSFVRCLKPNEDKKPGFFNERFVLLQIKYLGLVDSIKIRQKGYGIRRSYQEFYIKYVDLVRSQNQKPIENSGNEIKIAVVGYFEINWKIEIEKREVLLGKSKIFMKGGLDKKIEKVLREVMRAKEENVRKIVKQYQIYKFKKGLKFGIKGLRLVFRAIIKLQSKRKALKQRRNFLQKKKAISIIENIQKIQNLKRGFIRFFEKGLLCERVIRKKKALIKMVEIRKKKEFKATFLIFSHILKTLPTKKTVRFSYFEKRPCSIAKSPIQEPEPSRKSILKPSCSIKLIHSNENPLELPSKNEQKKPNVSKTFSKMDSINIGDEYKSFSDFPCMNHDLSESVATIPKMPPISYHFDSLFTSRDSLMIGNFSSIPKSIDCYLDFSSLDQEFIENVKNIDFLAKAGNILQKQRRWLQILSPDKILSHQKTPISKSLQKMNEKYTVISLKVFKLILQYSYELPSSSSLSKKVQKILAIVQAKPLEPELIDETYLQLIKQLRHNPNSECRQRIYRLMGVVASVRPPSIRLAFPVLNFLFFRCQELENREELENAKYAAAKIIDGFERGMRKVVPCENEIALLEFHKTVQVPINFLNGGCLILNVEPYSTVKEILEQLLKKLEKTHLLEYFGILEVVWKNNLIFSEIYLENDVFILDRVNIIEKLKVSEEFAGKPKPKMKFFLRIRLFYKFPEKDYDTIDLLASQYCRDIAVGKYLILSEQDLLQIMGFAVFLDFGEFSMEKSGKMTLNLERYIPGEQLLQKPAKFWFEGLMKSYSEVPGPCDILSRFRFLKVLQEKGIFFSHQFAGTHAKVVQSAKQEKNKIDFDCNDNDKENAINKENKEKNDITSTNQETSNIDKNGINEEETSNTKKDFGGMEIEQLKKKDFSPSKSKSRSLFYNAEQERYATTNDNDIHEEESSVKCKKENCFIEIKPLILFIRRENHETWRYEFDKIVKWGRFEERGLVIYTKDGVVHMLESNEIQEIEYLIKNYIRIAIKLSNPEFESNPD